jgi:hypothetical protein
MIKNKRKDLLGIKLYFNQAHISPNKVYIYGNQLNQQNLINQMMMNIFLL